MNNNNYNKNDSVIKLDEIKIMFIHSFELY